MADNDQQKIYRKETLDRMSSPEQLTDYLRVTNPGIWLVLATVILLLTGLLVWSAVGTLETRVDAKVVVKDYRAQIVVGGPETVKEGIPLRIDSGEYRIISVEQDEYGRTMAYAEVTLPDGIYDGSVVVEKIRPVEFLLESR